ncbi:MAG: type II toxin-antitoxin system VapC family toxin [Prolixibacteraceae bacterium]|nr:type II toxin-antitoxin system VapC family toxin [Prolixibacteraceae bacterium]
MGRTYYLIDTNIAIYYFGLALHPETDIIIDSILEGDYFISVINRIELLGFKDLSIQEEEALNSLISNAGIIDLNEEIILKTIEIRKNYKIKLPDAIIAATCIVNSFTLITNNAKDFKLIKGLNIANIH